MLTMLNFSRFLVVLTLFAVQSLAKPSVNEDFADYEEFDVGVPGTAEPTSPTSSSGRPECKIDLLILLDNSDSIGPTTFEKQVKEFFRNLINNEYLNVGPNGTHIAIITFSTQIQTKVLLYFGNITTKAGLLKYFKELEYAKLVGGGTRTGMAFKLANEMFKQKNPLNGGAGRGDVKDVVLIATDGTPVRSRGELTYGFYDFYDRKPEKNASRRRSDGEILMATHYSAKLHEKDIRVVGVCIGIYCKQNLLQNWTTTPFDAIQTKKAEFNTVASTLVARSCNKTDCSCPSRDPDVQYAKPGKKVYVEWKVPKANCTGGAVVLVEKTGRTTSGYYGVGSHTILYDYVFAKNITKIVAKCSVNFEVKDCKPDLMHPDCVTDTGRGLCECFDTKGADTYLEHGEDTAKLIWKRPKIRCGPNNKTKNVVKEVVTPEGTESPKYFEAGSHTITYKFTYQNGTKQLATLECPIKLKVKNCSCPSRDLDVQYAKPGEKAYVEWKVPEASCTGGAVDLVERTGRTTSGYYGLGSHTILYDYGLTKNKQKTVAKCSVKFEVKVCSCPSKDLGVFYMSPESDMGCKLPCARPKPNCPGLDYSRTSPSIGGAGEKESYAIGKHTVSYIYSMSNGLQVKCHVKLEIKVECGGEEYDPDKKQCCYGKLHDNQNPLWMCCGTAYYNPKLHKCCDLRNAHIVSTSDGECPNECASFAY